MCHHTHTYSIWHTLFVTHKWLKVSFERKHSDSATSVLSDFHWLAAVVSLNSIRGDREGDWRSGIVVGSHDPPRTHTHNGWMSVHTYENSHYGGTQHSEGGWVLYMDGQMHTYKHGQSCSTGVVSNRLHSDVAVRPKTYTPKIFS